MPHDTPLISTIVGGLVLAFIFGAFAHRLRMPPLVGYLIAGVLVGPHTPGYVADQSLAPELAEIGVILLMFGVGLHFSLKDLLSVRGIAVPGAIAQIAFATLLGWGLGAFMGWPTGGSLVFGLALSVASTVVLLKALQERRLVETERGRIAVGWLIVEDLAMVLALVLIPAAASIGGEGHAPVEPLSAGLSRLFGLDLGIGGMIAMTLVKVALFVALMLVFGRKLIPWTMHRIAHTGSRELFRLGVLAIALGVAFGAAKLFGVSLALGAFFAGMVLAESELSHRAAQESLPLRDAFAVLFFVSVGMLFDPNILIDKPLPILATIFIIVIGKSVAALLIVLAFKKPLGTALTISASLGQIGEFSFILAALGVELGLLPGEGRDLILAGAIISIILNPLLFFLCDRMRPLFEGAKREDVVADPAAADAIATQEETPAEDDEVHPTALGGHAILVGYGRVGSIVGQNLKSSATPFLVIEDSDKRIGELKAQGIETLMGNAVARETLDLANLSGARSIAIAIPNAFEACRIAEQARSVNPSILIVARAHSDAEVDELKHYGADTVIMGEREIGLGMVDRLAQVHHESVPYEDGHGPDTIIPADDPPPQRE
ncbi:CPA2 family monovalent cation:H+ antiporter-2 [Rhizobium leguminosarum]|uniref:CPA2 family monovalent cation:H+ antiporter-2 n=1 Tax=Rhizobium leguminosarum TaxID=384 RepID=A0AAE2MFK8_RHILE|nr:MULTISPECIES: YbaL family putative K(+) efflux transporter [Rhizobium]MBB4288429.1 CPA2 family monovalent cation:H+ antiporter-2 [Rhizobium leguminosarum]MBB4295478.1 CPA2 family monovalent cation:H+ antiporter-2 [Rhizobium leguminosarum]MBB4306872.1 CPA2 family monovalent cation:H+ antiporter-2 [Rhizobium leguminosarum]MBB4417546.1 CPA2 family monovalent cation:H+ antiporter-2 [Rhizobium leguminosarum]MBB4432390.1 CPA2 family monovalent cation:H+ antiporter-2 [Rhizobium esperanzae]